MALLEHVFDGTRENFQQLVVDNSYKGTVLVNYWAPNVGPCFKLWQVLEGLSREYSGRFLLVNVNTETQNALARGNGITSLPTVKVYLDGQIVESIYGAQSESSLRAAIDKYVQPARDSVVAQAILGYQSGQVEEALALLTEASSKTPDDIRLYSTAIKILLREKRYADIEQYVSGLPDKVQDRRDIDSLRVHARMLQLAEQASDPATLEQGPEQTPDALENILSRSAVAMVQNDFEAALAGLLQVFREDRYFADELPRKAMLLIFGMLGEQHELTKRYQKQLREMIH